MSSGSNAPEYEKVVWLLKKNMHIYLGSIRPPKGSIKSAKASQLKIVGSPEPISHLFVASVSEKDKRPCSARHFLTTLWSYGMVDPILQTRWSGLKNHESWVDMRRTLPLRMLMVDINMMEIDVRIVGSSDGIQILKISFFLQSPKRCTSQGKFTKKNTKYFCTQV